MKLRPLVASLGGAVLIYAAIEPWLLEVTHFDVHLENLPESAVGTRILQISDLHYGALMPRWMLDRILEVCQREQPDLIVLTGDMVSRRESYSHLTLMRRFAKPVMEYAPTVAQTIGGLHPPLGVYAVPGNHDLWNGSFDPIEEVLAQWGVQSLRNRSLRLENGLVLAGVDDLRAGRPEVREALKEVAYDEAQIILNHNPRLAMLMADRNALILSGHTHAGQVRLRGSQMHKFPVDLGRSFYLDEFYRLGKAQLYVSRGAGCVHFPLRFGARPEISVFTLKSN